MSALTARARPARIAPPATIITATLARFRRQLVTAWRHRNDMAVLASFDDFMLRDIGVTRGDLDDALAEPLWRDPTAVLVRRHGQPWDTRSAPRAVLIPAAPSLVPDTDIAPPSRRDPPAQRSP